MQHHKNAQESYEKAYQKMEDFHSLFIDTSLPIVEARGLLLAKMLKHFSSDADEENVYRYFCEWEDMDSLPMGETECYLAIQTVLNHPELERYALVLLAGYSLRLRKQHDCIPGVITNMESLSSGV